MSWTWQVEGSAGNRVEIEQEVPSFSSQSDAESWLGEVWRDLVDAGATQVSLVEDGRLVYGPMSLHPDGG